jgi:hypothetical protein
MLRNTLNARPWVKERDPRYKIQTCYSLLVTRYSLLVTDLINGKSQRLRHLLLG